MEEPKEMQNEVMEPETITAAPEETVSDNTQQPLADTSAEATDNSEQTEDPSNPASPQETDELVEEEPHEDYTAMSREEMVEALNQLLLTDDITAIKNRVGDLKIAFNEADKAVKKAAFEKFIEDGGNKDEYVSSDDAVAEAYRKAYNIYRERRQKHIDELEAQKQNNLQQKNAILDELRQLINSEGETLRASYDAFNAIQDRWKAIGEVPRSELNGLWQNYHFLVEQFFSKVKMNKELMLLDQKKNLESKTQLCEKAEELILEPSISKAAQGLQSLREQWREIGPVPVELNDEIWTRFRNAATQIDQRRREYYEQRRDEMEKNQLAKEALLQQVIDLTSQKPTTPKGWTEATTAIDETFKIWKTIGAAQRQRNEELWKQFKGTIDQFYADKKKFFDTIKDEYSENLNKKIELCIQAEAIAKRDDWKKATEEILNLQEQWKQIGPVGKKMHEKIWQRFRGACDEFFANKKEYFTTLRSSEKDNLEKKEAILAELKAYTFGTDKDENLTAIKDFQRRWMEVGHVPIAQKQRIQDEYRGTLNKLFEQLKITAREAEATAYRERIRNVLTDRKASSNERQNLVDQIQKLQNDLALWENNLGFLASSKQADILKQEFQHKMQKARQDIALLHAKIRMLDESMKESHDDNAQQGQTVNNKEENAAE